MWLAKKIVAVCKFNELTYGYKAIWARKKYNLEIPIQIYFFLIKKSSRNVIGLTYFEFLVGSVAILIQFGIENWILKCTTIIFIHCTRNDGIQKF